MNSGPGMRWARRDDVVVEVFSDGAVAFQAGDCRILALNDRAAALWDALAEPRTTGDLTARFGVDPLATLTELERLRIVKRRVAAACRRDGEATHMEAAKRYLANPAVSCRIEDDTGAILYNPEARNCQAINAVGLDLWQALSEPRTLDALTAQVCARYDGVTAEAAAADVTAFLDRLVMQGFIGEVAGEAGAHGL